MERILPVFNNHTQATRFLIFGPEGILRRHEYTVDVLIGDAIERELWPILC
jgi:hypothetical protein